MDIIRLFIPRDEECLKVLEELRWHGEPECPYCGSKDVKSHGTYERGEIEIPRYKCKRCKRTFSVLTGTVFERHKLPLGVMFYIIKKLPHMSINEIASELGLDYDSVHRFAMDVMKIAHGEISLEKLCVAVEIDEIYVNSGEKKVKKGLKDKEAWERSGDL